MIAKIYNTGHRIGLGCKTMTNTLAYYKLRLITMVKSFIVEVPEADLIFNLSYESDEIKV
jgi:hypothetical protein